MNETHFCTPNKGSQPQPLHPTQPKHVSTLVPLIKLVIVVVVNLGEEWGLDVEAKTRKWKA